MLFAVLNTLERNDRGFESLDRNPVWLSAANTQMGDLFGQQGRSWCLVVLVVVLVGGEDGREGWKGRVWRSFFGTPSNSVHSWLQRVERMDEARRLLVETKLHLDPLSLFRANSANC